MVGSYDDSVQAKWLADSGIELLRGNGRILDRGVVEVDGRRCQAGHIVIATGSEPVTATISLSAVPKKATYLRAWDERPGFLTLISDGEVLTGA